MPTCRVCHKELHWPSPYRKGAKPVNKDGTDHSCTGVNLFSCKYCPTGKVKGTAKEILSRAYESTVFTAASIRSFAGQDRAVAQ